MNVEHSLNTHMTPPPTAGSGLIEDSPAINAPIETEPGLQWRHLHRMNFCGLHLVRRTLGLRQLPSV